MTGAAQPVEPTGRECRVVVADLVEYLRGLAQEAQMLVFIEPRLGEHRCGEIDDRVEVTRERESGDRERVARQRDLEGGAERIERLVELGALLRASTAAGEQGGVTVQALDADRIGGRAAANRDFEPHERRIGRRLDDRSHESPSSSSSSSSSSSGSATTIVRCAGTKYVRTARATSAAVTAVSRSAIVDSRRKSPSAVS